MCLLKSSIQRNPRWRRFLYYASLVQDVRLSPGNLTPRLLPFLSFLVGDGLSILPSLRQLSWNVTIEPNDDLLYALAPTLEQLVVVVRAFPEEREDVQMAFDLWGARLRDKLAILSPRLWNLTILTTNMSSVGPVTSPDYFTRLHTVQVSTQTPALLGK